MKRALLVLLMTAMTAGVAHAAPEIDDKAAELLTKLSDHLKSQPKLAMTAAVEIKRTAAGFTQSDKRTYRFVIERPNKLRMQPVGDNADRGGTVIADGETVTAYAPPAGKYSQSEQSESLDELIDGQTMAVLSGGISQTVGPLLMSDPMAALSGAEGAEKIEYIEQGVIDGRPAHHLRVHRRGGSIDWWLDASGDVPLPIKAAPDLSAIVDQAKAAGQELELAMTLTLSDVTTEPEIADNTFAFAAPEGAKKVADLFEGPKVASGNPQGLVGKPAPAFTLKALDGQDTSLENLKGKIVILDFWATWCGPCRKAMPILQEVANEYANKDVVLYAVNLKEPGPKVAGFLKQMGWDVNVLLDEDGSVAGSYAVRGIPQTVIIGKDGVVKSVHVGVQPKQVITEELDKAIKGDAVAG